MHFKSPISQFKIVSSASKNAILLFQYAILHRKSTIRQFQHTIRQFKQAFCLEKHAILHFEIVVLQFKHCTLQFKPTILLFQRVIFSSDLLFDYGDIQSSNFIILFITSNIPAVFQTSNHSLRTWYLALVISNMQSFNSNIQTLNANTQPVHRRHLEPSPATHASENKEWHGVCSSGRDFNFFALNKNKP